MPVISICNLKGGTGKTTTTLNLGAALARAGKRVLLIDFDPQGNLTECLGREAEAAERDVYHLLEGGKSFNPIQISERLELLPTTLDLAAAEHALASEAGGSSILKEILSPHRDRYDYVLIDCSPSIGTIVINALTASDSIIVPIQAEYLALQGLKKLTDVIEKTQRRLNSALKVSGILITQYDSRTVLSRQIADAVQERFRAEIFETKIRQNVAIAESQANNLDIFSYAPQSAGAEDYAALSAEVIKRHG
jgi:chromosome partitioning protein